MGRRDAGGLSQTGQQEQGVMEREEVVSFLYITQQEIMSAAGQKKKKTARSRVNAELLTLTIYIKGIRLVSNLNLQTQWELNPLAYQIQKNNKINK